MSEHAIALEPRAAAIVCSCGARFDAHGALAAAMRHVAVERRNAALRNSEAARKRRSRREDLAGAGLMTTEAAHLWGLRPAGAYKYLAGLAREGVVRKALVRGFPCECRWTAVETGAP